MSLHYSSNHLWDQIVFFLATHQVIAISIMLILLVVASYFTITDRIDIAMIITFTTLIFFACVPVVRISHNSYMTQNFADASFDRYVYHQSDYQIDTSTTYQLHEADDTYHHPTKEGWADTPTGQIKGQIADPQGQLTQVKHGEQGTDLVEITYTIDGTEHKATVHVSDEKFIKLWYFVREKPLPLSVLDNGDFVVNRYSHE